VAGFPASTGKRDHGTAQGESLTPHFPAGSLEFAQIPEMHPAATRCGYFRGYFRGSNSWWQHGIVTYLLFISLLPVICLPAKDGTWLLVRWPGREQGNGTVSCAASGTVRLQRTVPD
jgi:hypothetical protein